jgi:YHS domain-containing protein
MFRSTLLCAAVALLAVTGCKKKEPAPGSAGGAQATGAPAPSTNPSAVKAQTLTSPEMKVGDTTRCPVSDESFKVEANSSFAVHQGKKIYFCCDKCKKPFEKDPAKYLKGS